MMSFEAQKSENKQTDIFNLGFASGAWLVAALSKSLAKSEVMVLASGQKYAQKRHATPWETALKCQNVW